MKLPSRLEVTPVTDRILMSETLKGQVDEDYGTAMEPVFVTVVGQYQTPAKKNAIVGSLVSVEFEACPVLEFRTMLDEAFTIVNAPDLSFLAFELHLGEKEDITKMPGPFTVVSAKIHELDPTNQMCTLKLTLQRSAR